LYDLKALVFISLQDAIQWVLDLSRLLHAYKN